MEIKKLNFCYFGFDEIKTELNKEGEEKKILTGLLNKNCRDKLKPKQSYFGAFSTAIITGKQSNITVLDCDSQDAYDFLLQSYPDFKSFYTVKTNNGYHIYCTYTDKLKTTTNKKAKIDVRNDGGLIIAPPTKYTLLNGSIAQYKYIGGVKLGEIPESIIEIIPTLKKTNNNTNKKIYDTKQTNTLKEDEDYFCECVELPDHNLTINLQLYAFFDILNVERLSDYEPWISVGFLFYSLDLPWQFWDKLSQKYPDKYDRNACFNKWNTFKKKNPYAKYTLFSWCKNDDIVAYCKLKKQYNYELVFDAPIIADNIEYVKIEEDYLLDEKVKGEVYTIKESIDTYLNRLFTEDSVSSLNIRSPYGTSKTQLLIKSIEKYQVKKILFLSYRKTLTYDIQNNFQKIGFGNYLENDLNCNRLIIQCESILKLDYIFNNDEVPQYDLVIIDESERVMSQFNSKTFDGNGKKSFEYLEAIIANCGKLITLDGDQSNRTYSFTSQFEGTSINIINTIKNNNKIIQLTEDEQQFKEDICASLSKGQNLVICSQSASLAETYEQQLKEQFPDKKIMLYVGQMDDNIKTEHAKNVLEHWAEYDCILYSPTFEAGVNFDKEHFDKCYCILSSGSGCQAAVYQMLARVRKFTSNKILTFTNGIKDYDIAEFYTFEEVKRSLINTRDKILNYKYEKDVDGKMKRMVKLDSYDINSIYNQVEDLNKNGKYFLPFFKQLGINKGFQFESIIKGEDTSIRQSNTGKYDQLIEAKDVDDDMFKYLFEKQKKGTAKKEDKIQIEKEIWKRRLGVKTLDENILKLYHKKEYLIYNYLSLINPKTEIDFLHLDYDKQKQILKLKIVNQLISKLGFSSVYDDKIMYQKEFEERMFEVMDETPIFKLEQSEDIRIQFGLCKSQIKISDKAQALKYINEILKSYCIKLERTVIEGKRNDKKNQQYKIVRMNYIDEIVSNLIYSGKVKLSDDTKYIEPTHKAFSNLGVREKPIPKVEADVKVVVKTTKPKATKPIIVKSKNFDSFIHKK